MIQTVLAMPAECVTPKLTYCVKYLHSQIRVPLAPRKSCQGVVVTGIPGSNSAKTLVKESNGLTTEQDYWFQAKEKELGKSWEL